MKLTRTITFDGDTKAEYEQIKAHLESLQSTVPGWTLIPEPVVNRMTATKTEEVFNFGGGQ